MALVLETFRVGQNTGNHAAHRVGHRHGGDLPAGEDKIPKGNFFIHTLVDEALVDTLVVAADQDQVRQLTQPDSVRLGKGVPAGRQEHGMDRPFRVVTGRLPAAVQGVCLHDGAPAAAVGVVVYLVLLVGGIVPDLPGIDLNVATLLGTAQDALGEHIPHRIREQCQNLNPHRFPSPPAASLPSYCLPYPHGG